GTREGWIKDSSGSVGAAALHTVLHELGLSRGSLDWVRQQDPSIYNNVRRVLDQDPKFRSALRSAVSKRYLTTQRVLRELGTDRITLYRGISLSPQQPYKHNPVESWTTDFLVTARVFAFNDDAKKQAILRMDVPRERIYDSYITGDFPHNEEEFMVLPWK